MIVVVVQLRGMRRTVVVQLPETRMTVVVQLPEMRMTNTAVASEVSGSKDQMLIREERFEFRI